jgi:hypothetical protein
MRPPPFARTAYVAAVAIILLAGCESIRGSQAQPSPSPSASATASPPCHPLGGTCLGDLAAGTYTTATFRPQTTYTVPSGWNNGMDLPTSFLLARTDDPVVDLYGGNAIQVTSNVAAAAQNCDERAEPGVGRTAQAFALWLAGLPAVRSPGPRPTTLGGLTGFVIDAQLAPTWTGSCPFGAGSLIPVTIAGDPAQFRRQRAILPAGVSIRLYILDRPDGGNIAILVSDIPDGISFADYLVAATPVVGSMHFMV